MNTLAVFLLVCGLGTSPALSAGLQPRAILPDDLSQLDSQRYRRLHERSEEELGELARQLMALPVPLRVAAFAFLQVGTPYAGGALGEEVPPDGDPFIRFDVTDCTILNLTSVALAHTTPETSTRRSMAVAGYRDPTAPSFASRLHFTTDRIDVSPYFRDVTGRYKGTQTKNVRLNRRKDGTRWIAINWERDRRVTYLPVSTARKLKRSALPEVLGVAFLKTATLEDGLDVVHEGLLYRGRTVVHASSKAGRVVTEPWSRMLDRYDGVVFFEYR